MNVADRNGVFVRRLLGTIERMVSFTPIALAVVQNARLADVWEELDNLEDDGVVRRTKRRAQIDSDAIFEADPTLSESVVRMREGTAPVLEAPVYEKTKEWSAFYADWLSRNGGA